MSYHRLKLREVDLKPFSDCKIFNDQEQSLFVLSPLMGTIYWGYGIFIMIS